MPQVIATMTFYPTIAELRAASGRPTAGWGDTGKTALQARQPISLEQRHRRYMAGHCCHLCGGSTCTCGQELFWEPEEEDWGTFWARFQEMARLPAMTGERSMADG